MGDEPPAADGAAPAHHNEAPVDSVSVVARACIRACLEGATWNPLPTGGSMLGFSGPALVRATMDIVTSCGLDDAAETNAINKSMETSYRGKERMPDGMHALRVVLSRHGIDIHGLQWSVVDREVRDAMPAPAPALQDPLDPGIDAPRLVHPRARAVSGARGAADSEVHARHSGAARSPSRSAKRFRCRMKGPHFAHRAAHDRHLRCNNRMPTGE